MCSVLSCTVRPASSMEAMQCRLSVCVCECVCVRVYVYAQSIAGVLPQRFLSDMIAALFPQCLYVIVSMLFSLV